MQKINFLTIKLELVYESFIRNSKKKNKKKMFS